MLRLIPCRFLVAATLALAAVLPGCPGCRSKANRPDSGLPRTHPASQPGQPGQPTQADDPANDWPAFHRGGALLGVGPAIPPPPMETRWTYRIEKASIDNGAAIVGEWVYVADDLGGLHCIGLTTGQRRWLFTSEKDSGFATAPLVAGGRVFLGDKDGMFYAVAADTGKLLWKYNTGSEINSSANLTDDGNVVFGNDGGKIVCLAADNGKLLWTVRIDQTNGAVPTYGAVAMDGAVGWSASCDRTLRSIDLRTGEVLQTIELNSQTGATPTVTEHGVIVGDISGKVSCIDPASGRVSWLFDKIEDEAFVYSSAACCDGIVVVGARDHNVYGINAETGGQRWVFPTQGDVDASPAISGGRVYVPSKDGKLYVLDLKGGKLLWTFEAADSITSSPAVGQGVVVFGDAGGNVYCLGPKK